MNPLGPSSPGSLSHLFVTMQRMFDQDLAGEPQGEGGGGLSDAEVLLGSCATAVHAASTVAARIAPKGLDVGVLSGVTLQIEATRRMLDAAEAHLLVELDDREGLDKRLGITTSRWLAREAGVPSGVARQRLSVARKLRDVLPEVDAALVEDRISWDHARVIADAVNDRNVDLLRPLLGDVIDAAGSTVFGRWRRETQALASLLDADGPHDPANDLARDVLKLSESDDLTLIRAELTAESALTVSQALQDIADELFRQWTRDCGVCPDLEMPTRPMLLGQALVEMARRSQAVPVGDSRPPKVEVTLVIHQDHPDLVVDPCGSPFPAAALPVFLCDPTIHAVLLDSCGLPVSIGRSSRVPTLAHRRALAVRDGGCTFPGCEARIAWTDAHHVRPWGRHGPSDLDNFASLCRRHHGVAHRRGWTMVLEADGWTRWTTPGGRTFRGQQHQRTRAGPDR